MSYMSCACTHRGTLAHHEVRLRKATQNLLKAPVLALLILPLKRGPYAAVAGMSTRGLLAPVWHTVMAGSYPFNQLG